MINKYNTQFTALLIRSLKTIRDNALNIRLTCTLRNWWRYHERRKEEWWVVWLSYAEELKVQ